jgi:transposase
MELQSIPAAAQRLSYSQRLVTCWVQRYIASGGVEDLPRSGRKHALNDQAMATAHELLLSNHHGGAQNVAGRLFDLGISLKQLGRKSFSGQ